MGTVLHSIIDFQGPRKHKRRWPCIQCDTFRCRVNFKLRIWVFNAPICSESAPRVVVTNRASSCIQYAFYVTIRHKVSILINLNTKCSIFLAAKRDGCFLTQHRCEWKATKVSIICIITSPSIVKTACSARKMDLYVYKRQTARRGPIRAETYAFGLCGSWCNLVDPKFPKKIDLGDKNLRFNAKMKSWSVVTCVTFFRAFLRLKGRLFHLVELNSL